MKIYFDESGNTGCVLRKEKLLNFQSQPTFVLGAIIVNSDEDEKYLIQRYKKFKKKFNIKGIIKGNELHIRNRNKELSYLIENILDSNHFRVILYDKRFYISTLFLNSLLSREFYKEYTMIFYEYASVLSRQDDDFFLAYLNYIENPTLECFKEYLLFLKEYDYKYIMANDNIVLMMINYILDNNKESLIFDDFMTYGWYNNKKQTNVINLNALSELIYVIKEETQCSNSDIIYIHDYIEEFQQTFESECSEMGIDIKFARSNDEELLQLVDNITSIMHHAYEKMIYHFKLREEWSQGSEWDLKLIATIINKINEKNINYTVPIHDWALSLSVQKIFSQNYPLNKRNNFNFNRYYIMNIARIKKTILENIKEDSEIIEILNN